MPFKSVKQRRFIYMKASKGAKWAKKFVKHSKGKISGRKRKRRSA
jgi:hypothetical protein